MYKERRLKTTLKHLKQNIDRKPTILRPENPATPNVHAVIVATFQNLLGWELKGKNISGFMRSKNQRVQELSVCTSV